jgi:hypothetical protein
MENQDHWSDDKRQKDEETIQLSDKYTLTIQTYKQGEQYWSYTRGLIKTSAGELIFDIKRNYSDFWYKFIEHFNGNDYLLCGEDYQGYNILNLTTKQNHKYISEDADKGFGFCWTEVIPSPGNKKIMVEGCIWACPYQKKIYDFTDPDKPLVELFDDRACFDFQEKSWINDDEFEFYVEKEEKEENDEENEEKRDNRIIEERTKYVCEEVNDPKYIFTSRVDDKKITFNIKFK